MSGGWISGQKKRQISREIPCLKCLLHGFIGNACALNSAPHHRLVHPKPLFDRPLVTPTADPIFTRGRREIHVLF
jgi:hypothetical protein